MFFFQKIQPSSGQGGTAASEKYPGGSPFTCRGEGKRKIGNPIHNVPLNPPLAKQDKEILDAWFYSCKAEKCPEIPLQTCKGGKRKLGIQQKVPISPPYPKNTRKSLEFGSLPQVPLIWCNHRQSSNRTNLHVARALRPTCLLLQKAIQISLVSSKQYNMS